MAEILVNSPIGQIRVVAQDGALVRLTWGADRTATGDERTPLLAEAADQLAAYFAGQELTFDLPLRPAGSPFQRAVWDEMCRIPPGETATYGELAQRVGNVARAVGLACGANPIPIIIPCHRVLAAGGRLGGFSGAGGVATKRTLLTHEGALPPSLF